jgi:hypothetical protein
MGSTEDSIELISTKNLILNQIESFPVTLQLRVQRHMGFGDGLFLPLMPGIPKSRKESHPERAKDKKRPIYPVRKPRHFWQG